MLIASPIAGAEEWAIHDYEGLGDVQLEEYAGFDRVSALASFITEHGEIGAALLDYYSGDLDEAQQAIADRYMGEHASLADYVQELTEESTLIPQPLRYYIDYQAMARDAELNGELFGISTAYPGGDGGNESADLPSISERPLTGVKQVGSLLSNILANFGSGSSGDRS
jgi:Antirestriction protein (ArdA)